MNANEPIRRNMLIAGSIVGLSTLFVTLGMAATITIQVVCTAIGAGLGQLAVIAFGVERSRDKAWGPESVDGLMDADTVIRQSEHR